MEHLSERETLPMKFPIWWDYV